MSEDTSLARFWAKVDYSGGADACWEWQGALNPRGYGQFRHEGQMRQAHRWILGKELGTPLRWDAEAREEACHHCDNRSCVNPAHLYVGSHQDNMQDCVRRGRHTQANKTHCPAGHPYDEANTIVNPNGERSCRECLHVRYRATQIAEGKQPAESAQARAEARWAAEYCCNGHLRTPENTILRTDAGTWKCRDCQREAGRRSWHRRKAAKEVA